MEYNSVTGRWQNFDYSKGQQWSELSSQPQTLQSNFIIERGGSLIEATSPPFRNPNRRRRPRRRGSLDLGVKFVLLGPNFDTAFVGGTTAEPVAINPVLAGDYFSSLRYFKSTGPEPESWEAWGQKQVGAMWVFFTATGPNFSVQQSNGLPPGDAWGGWSGTTGSWSDVIVPSVAATSSSSSIYTTSTVNGTQTLEAPISIQYESSLLAGGLTPQSGALSTPINFVNNTDASAVIQTLSLPSGSLSTDTLNEPDDQWFSEFNFGIPSPPFAQDSPQENLGWWGQGEIDFGYVEGFVQWQGSSSSTQFAGGGGGSGHSFVLQWVLPNAPFIAIEWISQAGESGSQNTKNDNKYGITTKDTDTFSRATLTWSGFYGASATITRRNSNSQIETFGAGASLSWQTIEQAAYTQGGWQYWIIGNNVKNGVDTETVDGEPYDGPLLFGTSDGVEVWGPFEAAASVALANPAGVLVVGQTYGLANSFGVPGKVVFTLNSKIYLGIVSGAVLTIEKIGKGVWLGDDLTLAFSDGTPQTMVSFFGGGTHGIQGNLNANSFSAFVASTFVDPARPKIGKAACVKYDEAYNLVDCVVKDYYTYEGEYDGFSKVHYTIHDF
jgi:hypothetical protein